MCINILMIKKISCLKKYEDEHLLYLIAFYHLLESYYFKFKYTLSNVQNEMLKFCHCNLEWLYMPYTVETPRRFHVQISVFKYYRIYFK